MEIKLKASFNWDLDLQSFIFGDMNDKGRRTFSVSFLFCKVHMAVRPTICKWTVVMKKTEAQWLSARVLDSRPRDSSLSRTGTTAFSSLCPRAKHIALCLVLV